MTSTLFEDEEREVFRTSITFYDNLHRACTIEVPFGNDKDKARMLFYKKRNNLIQMKLRKFK